MKTIAKLIGSTERTVYRYLDLLKAVGFNVEKDTNHKVYIDNGVLDIKQMFTAEEIKLIQESIKVVAVNQVQYRGWNFAMYIQQSNKTFKIDNSIFSYSINSTRHGFWKPKILYYDYNGDGKKDLSYIDDADNGEIKYKSVFIRTGNQFSEQDFYQIDPYAKSIFNNLIK
jgi:hypothetical protein